MSETTRGVFIYFNEAELTASIDRATIKASKLTAEMENVSDKSSPKFKALAVDLEANNKKIETLTKTLSGELNPSLRQIEASAKKAWNELNNLPIGSPEWQSKMTEFKTLNTELIKAKDEVGRVGTAFNSLASTIKGVALGTILGQGIQLAATALGSYLLGIVQGAGKISDSFADIAKTTNLTNKEIKQLSSELSKIDTRTSSADLRELAVAAGKLGIQGVDDIAKFVEEANQIKVALGEDLGKDAITEISKVSSIFKVGALNIASGINEIGQSSAASEGYQTAFLFRMAGVSQTAKLAAGDILGFGAALDINGQELEKSSTALQTFFIRFIKDTETFGKAAGFAEGALGKLISEKGVNAGFIEFLRKLKEANPTAGGLLSALEKLGIDGARGASTFLTLANNLDLVSKQQVIANAAIEKGTSVTAEYEKRNNDLAATFARIGKEWGAIIASSTITEAIGAAGNILLLFLKALRQLPEFIQLNSNLLISLAGAFLFYNTSALAAAAATAYEASVTAIASAAKTVYNGILVLGRGFQLAYAAATLVATGEITVLTAATWLLSAATSSVGGIFTVVVGAFIAAGTAIAVYANSARSSYQVTKLLADVIGEAAANTAKEKSQLELLLSVAQDETISKEKRKQAIKELNKLSPEYLGNLKLETINTEKAATAIDKYIKSIEALALAEAIKAKRVELNKKLIETETATTESFITTMDKVAAFASSNLASSYYAGINNKKQAIITIKDEIAALDELYKKKIKTGAVNLPSAPIGNSNLLKPNAVSGDGGKAAADKKLKIQQDLMQSMEKLGKENLSREENEYRTTIEYLTQLHDVANTKIKEQYANGALTKEEFDASIIYSDIIFTDSKLKIAQDYADGKNKATEDVGKFELSYQNQILDEHIRVNNAIQDSDEKLAANKKKLADEAVKNKISELDAISKEVAAAAKTESIIANQVKDIADLAFANELQNVHEAAQTKIQALDFELEHNIIKKKDYDRKVAAINKAAHTEEVKLKKEAFKVNQALQVVQAGIDTAVAAIAAYKAGLETGGPAGLALGPVMAAIVAAFGVVKIGFIADQRAPEFKYGGRIDNGLKLSGPSHSAPGGGIWMVNPETGNLVAKAEGNEWLINTNSSAKFDGALSAINSNDETALYRWVINRPNFRIPEGLAASSTSFQKNYFQQAAYNDNRLRETVYKSNTQAAKYIVQGVTNAIHASNNQDRKL